jgi:mannosyltransferase OCH1-like enzyme
MFPISISHLPLFLHCLPLFDHQVEVHTDLFKYLVLWHSGGIFVDIRADEWIHGVVQPRDGLLWLNDQQHEHDAVMMFDQNDRLPLRAFLAASPRHPLMFLALAQSLRNFGSDLHNILPALSLPLVHTGPYALVAAFRAFMNFDESMIHYQTQLLRQGPYTGLEQRAVTVTLQQQESGRQPMPTPRQRGRSGPLPQCPPLLYNAIAAPSAERKDILPLSHVTDSGGSEKGMYMRSSNETCPPGLLYFQDHVLPPSITHANRKIPKIIHVTGKTRCLSPDFYNNLETWKTLENHSVYFHDDVAVDRLLNKKWMEFPHLQLVRSCIHSGAGLADLWRYLVLWEYGGIYTDMDSAPGYNLLNGTAITADDDAFLIIERSGTLAQYWLSASPKHPHMFNAVLMALKNLMNLEDVGSQFVPRTTGPLVIVNSFKAFLGQGGRNPSLGRGGRHPSPGHYIGLGNRTVTVIGSVRETNSWVLRDAIPKSSINHGYASMGIVNYRNLQRKPNFVSCFARMLETANTNKRKREIESGLPIVGSMIAGTMMSD